MPNAVTPSPPARPRRKHRLLKLMIALLVALAIVVVAVYAFLGSDYPRQIAIRIAQNVTGLRVDIGKLNIDPGGKSSLADLRVSLPLAERPFLTVGSIHFTHRIIVGVLVTLDPGVRRVSVNDVHLDARQQPDGVWNLQQVLNQLTTPGKNASAGGVPPLPAVEVWNAAATVTLADGRTADFKDIRLSGRPQNALAYTFDADAGGLATLKGELSAAGRFPHTADVTIKPALLNALQPLVGRLPTMNFAYAQLNWAGERTATGVAGRLTIPEKSTQVGPVIAHGAATIHLDPAGVRVSPENLTVVALGVPALTLAGGTVTLAGDRLTLDGVRARFADGSARLDGSTDLVAQRGNVSASWEQIAFPLGVVHAGEGTLEIANIWPGRPWVKGAVHLSGTVGGGAFETQGRITGDGPRWDDATYVIDIPVARYARRSELRFADLRAVVHNTADSVELVRVGVRQTAAGTASLDARGVYHFAGDARGAGNFTAVGSGFAFGGERNLAFNVNAWADDGSVTLQNAHANLGTEGWVNLAGQYTFGRPEPVAMQLDLDTSPDLSLTLSNQLKLAGHVSGSMKVGGTLQPTRVTLDGRLASRGLKVDRFVVGDADLLVRGSLLADRADVQTERLSVFGGEGWFGADFPYFSDELHAWMGFEKIDLAEIGRAVGTERVTGTAAGQFDVHVPVGELHRVYGTGRIAVDGPQVKPLLVSQSLTIPVRIGDGYASVAPRATQAAGGTAAVTALVSLNEPTKFKLNVDLKNWLTQLPLAEFSVLSSGVIDLPQVDLPARAVSGRVAVDHMFFAHEQAIGDVGVRASAGGRQVKLERLTGQVLGGKVSGQGSINFNDLAQGRFTAAIDGLSLDRLAQLDPRLVGVQGRLSASINSHAADVPNPLGPVQADLVVTSDRAAYKGIEIGNSRVRVFADRSRITLADDPTDPNVVAFAGGTARLWGRLSQVPATDVGFGGDGVERTSVFASVQLDGIDTEQLNKMIDPDGRPVPGRLSGDVVAFGNAADVRGLSGQGNLKLADSDLGNIGLFAALYNAMRLGLAPSTPNGYGDVSFRLTSGRLDVTGLNYFNRGVYAKGALALENVLDLKHSPVSGYVLGTFRPLKDLKLPFFGTIDSILDALQSSATTLRIDGTMKQIKATPVSLNAVSGNLKNILIGEAQAK